MSTTKKIYHKVTTEDLNTIRKMSPSYSAREISEVIGISDKYINDLRRQYGIPASRGYSPWSKEETDELVSLYNQGAPLGDIENKLIRSHVSVENKLVKLRKAGIITTKRTGNEKYRSHR